MPRGDAGLLPRPSRLSAGCAAAQGVSVGRLTTIGPFGFRTELAAGLLVAPGKIAIGPDNAVYVTVNSTSAGSGEVWRITQ